MTESPILFSGPMVHALLDGRKTQTRRIVKPQFAADAQPEQMSRTSAEGFQIDGHSGRWWDAVTGSAEDAIRCPYGAPGDRLWVKETHVIYDTHGQHREDGQRWGPWGHLPTRFNEDRTKIAYFREGFDRCDPGRWRPSIHMPRWASRLTLAITDVRVERLQDISEADAIAEGLYRSIPDERDRDWFAAYTEEQTGSPPTPGEWETFNAGVWMVPGVPQGWGLTPSERRRDTWGPTPQFCYRLLWEHINGNGSWDANPWVWAVTFEVAA